MLVKHIDHRIPKRKRQKYSEEKHNKSAVRKQNRNNRRNKHQNKMILKRLNTDFERLEIIKTFEENQCRNKQSHRDPKENKEGNEITDHAPCQRVDHKQKEIMPAKTRKKITRFRFFTKIQFSVNF